MHGRIFMPLGDATEALDTFYPYFRLVEAGYDVVVAGPDARLYHTVLHEIPPDSAIPWDITRERPGYFIRATAAFRDLRTESFVGAFVSGGRAPEYLRYDEDLLHILRGIDARESPIACVCHGIEILTAADLIRSRTVTTVAKCAADARQGGAAYVDQPVVEDGHIVTARTWHDNAPLLRAFLKQLDRAHTATPIGDRGGAA